MAAVPSSLLDPLWDPFSASLPDARNSSRTTLWVPRRTAPGHPRHQGANLYGAGGGTSRLFAQLPYQAGFVSWRP